MSVGFAGRLSVVVWVLLVCSGVADAACDVIPSAVQSFQGTRGAVDRPFAMPGDWVAVRRSGKCATSAASPGFSDEAQDHVVLVTFVPPGSSARTTIVLAAPGRCAAFPGLQVCLPGQAIVGSACCQPVSMPTDPDAVGFVLGTTAGDSFLRFRLPDTDAAVGAPDDDVTFAGQAIIAVAAHGTPGLAAALALQNRGVSCQDVEGLVACIDHLFTTDGTCSPANPDPTFPAFTALPPPNSYAAMCTTPTICRGGQTAARFTIDAVGNLLVPMEWRDVLVDQTAGPVPLLLEVRTSVPASPGGEPIAPPDRRVFGSYDVRGAKLGPLFDPQVDASNPGQLVLQGSTDQSISVLRVARRSCEGGSLPFTSCVDDADCPGGGVCGEPLFDFASRTANGAGAITDFVAVARDPVPLDGLNQSETVNAFVISERLVSGSMNRDDDQVDHVVDLADRNSGQPRPIGEGGASGRALLRVNLPFVVNLPRAEVRVPLSRPALAVDGDLVAFLESEPGEALPQPALLVDNDPNGNGRVADGILRVYEVANGAAEPLGAGLDARAPDAAPLVDGRSLAWSREADGTALLFYRRAEAASAPRLTELASVAPNGEPLEDADMPAISGDGNVVSFRSFQTMFGPDPLEDPDFFARNRAAGTAEVLSAPDGSAQEGGAEHTFQPDQFASLSYDGRYAVFETESSLNADDPGGNDDVYLRDTDALTSVAVSRFPNGDVLDLFAEQAFLAPDASAVCYAADEEALTEPSTSVPLVIRDLALGVNIPAAPTLDGDVAGGRQCTLSLGGRYMSFLSDDGGPSERLVPGDTNTFDDVFVFDRDAGVVERVNVSTRGEQANDDAYATFISYDGRIVAFDTIASNLVDGDTNTSEDIFVHDRVSRITERISVSSQGEQGDSRSEKPWVSADGRWVAFISDAENLVHDDDNGSRDYFVHDRLTGITERVSVTSAGGQADGDESGWDYDRWYVALSADGQTVAFHSEAANLVSEPPLFDGVYTRAPAPPAATTDLFRDAVLDDTVLEIMDPVTGTVFEGCQAGATRLDGGRAAYLRPESSSAATSGHADCVAGPLNADGDVADDVVHLWTRSGGNRSLGRAATEVAMAGGHVAALVPPPNPGGRDAGPTELAVYSLGSSMWLPLPALPADRVAFCGQSRIVFTTPGAGGARMLRILDLAVTPPFVVDVGEPAEDFVCSDSLVAFRTRETHLGGRNLNPDSDTSDDVLQGFDLHRAACVGPAAPTNCLANTEIAVRPCDRPGCDPATPYQVTGDTVRFLTFERDQGMDLSGDLDDEPDPSDPRNHLDEVVLQVFNFRFFYETGDADGALTTIGAAQSGVCTAGDEACFVDSDCTSGTCAVPPIGCVRGGTPPVACNPGACGSGETCAPGLADPATWTCQTDLGQACQAHADCPSDSRCSDDSASTLAATLPGDTPDGIEFEGAGRCLDDVAGPACSAMAPCSVGNVCSGGVCRRDHGICATQDDCPPASTCTPDEVLTSTPDTDSDGVLDPIDNCPTHANAGQADADADGVGDVCATCPPEPRQDCAAPPAGKAQLVLKRKPSQPRATALRWKWRKGPPATPADIGDPMEGTGYTLCIYDDDDPQTTFALGMPGRASCKGKGCWRRSGQAYQWSGLSADGVQGAKVSPGDGGFDVKAKGARLSLPPMPLAGAIPRAQLVSDTGACWDARFPAPRRNTAINYTAFSG